MRKPGRPISDDVDTRPLLLEAAKRCFSQHPYHKVTTRKLAEESGVNAGLIRYYFINKEGLYKAMFLDMVETITGEVNQLVKEDKVENFEPLFRSFARLMFKYPEFPKLMFKEMQGDGICQDFIMDAVRNIPTPLFDKVAQQLQEKGKLKPGFNFKLLRMSAVSLMVFPILNFEVMEHVDGLELNEALMEEMILHNLKLFQHGCFNDEN